MIVHDLMVNDKYVRIGYIRNEKEYPQACTLQSQEYGRPELYRAITGIGQAMANLDATKDYDIEVSKVCVKYTRDNQPSNFTITGDLLGAAGLNMKFKTEKIRMLFDRELTRNVVLAIREAELFIAGKRAQAELQFDDDNEYEEGGRG